MEDDCQNYFGSNSRTPIRTLFVDDLCVHSSARGSHIGKALLEYAERYALEKNCYNLTLNVWSFNQRAVRFYENAGLKPMETTMEKILVK
ncbi:MAG: GNAT family N-acetyltransferase [Erysipelotrichia bacterium]|nr:GNAT family N-acetyltransferase [Erysipelotrichia bacterium]